MTTTFIIHTDIGSYTCDIGSLSLPLYVQPYAWCWHRTQSTPLYVYGWDIDHVRDNLQLRMYCSSFIKHPSGDSRTFWSTESRYPYGDHSRKDFVEISMGDGHVGLAQVVSFLHLTHLPPEETHLTKDLMLIRWLSPSSLSNARDSCNRPLCDYPLSHNFCLWEWSRIPVRLCYRQRGFRRVVHRPPSEDMASYQAPRNAKWVHRLRESCILWCHRIWTLDNIVYQ